MKIYFLGRDEYTNFVENYSPYISYFSFKFLDYHKREWNHIGIKEGDRLMGVIPGVVEGSTFHSLKGASFGGVLIKGGIKEKIRYIEGVKDFLIKEGIERIEITLPPCLNEYRDSSIDFILWKAGFVLDKMVLGVYIDLEDYEISKHHIRNIKKSAPITVRRAEVEEVYPLIKETWKRFGKEPTHTIEDLLFLRKNFPEFIQIYAGYRERELLSAILFFKINSKVYLSFYPVQNEYAREKKVMFSLMHQVMEELKRKGVKIIDMGTVSNGDINENLIRFKINWGGRFYTRNRYTFLV